MAKPVILMVDDEPQVLNAIARDLRKHFKGDYRIVKAGGGNAALDATRRLKERGDTVALFLSDQRMPDIEGTEFLARASKLYPEAGKVLLTAYADTQAAIRSINEIGLDHYLMKPWDPPEENLYPVLDDLLDEWAARNPVDYDGIRVAGAMWSRESHEAKDFLARNRIPYQWLDVDSNPIAAALAEGSGDSRLPVVFFPDGAVLHQPTREQLAEQLGMKTTASGKHYELAVIGAGPAGLAAAVYGAAEGLDTILIEKEAAGGQAGTSSRIENYLGFPKGLSGTDLAQRAMAQVKRLGTGTLLSQEVTSIRIEEPYKILTFADGSEISAYAVVLATGMAVRRIMAKGVADLTGAGVYYGAALTEARNFEGKHVFVVGGANSAGQGAMWFARWAKQVTLLVRGADLVKSMSRYLIDRIEAAPNMDVWPFHEVEEAKGDGHLTSLVLKNNQTGELTEHDAAAMFIFIGSRPYSDLVADLVVRDERGFIKTGHDLIVDGKRPKGWRLARDPYLLETNIPGLFVAGDVRHGTSKRVAAATGEGSVVVFYAYRYVHSV
jgi:thioredoxin reductase (NADPH)